MDKLNRSSMLAVRGILFYILVLFLGVKLLYRGGVIVIDWSLRMVGWFDFRVPFIMDRVSLCFSFVVVLISSCVVGYSTRYMDSEENISRFVWLVILFVGFINLVIFVPRILGIILGWDGLGLISFLLVAYYQNREALGAGLVTAFIGRVGDVFLFISVVFLRVRGQWNYWSLDFFGYGGWVVFFIVIIAITKSAQVPFSYWLPIAIRAPTPVSALVHSSTLVTAGVYFLFRVLPVVDEGVIFPIIFLIGVSLFTLSISGFRACFESDLKKVVALSTLRQLGVIIFALGVGWYELGFFHLVSHALFKALIFIGVGRVIHGCGDFQELRDGGGLWLKIPFTRGCLVLARMSLVGVAFIRGFYSKDLVVESFLGGQFSLLVGFCLIVGMMGTVIYVGRFFMCSVWGKINRSSVQEVERRRLYEVLPVLVLGLGAVSGGFLIQGYLFYVGEIVVLEGIFKRCLRLALIVGVIVVFLYSLFNFSIRRLVLKVIRRFFARMWFGSFMVAGFNFLGLGGGYYSNKVDLGWNEKVLGGLGLFRLIIIISSEVLSYFRLLTWFWGSYSRHISSFLVVSFFFFFFFFIIYW